KLKVLEDGRIVMCTTCEFLEIRYEAEINASEEFRTRLEDARGTADPNAKADLITKLQEDLARERGKRLAAEDPAAKPALAEEAADQASDALDRLQRTVDANDNILNARHGRLRGQLKAALEDLNIQLEGAKADLDAAKKLGDPAWIEEARGKL